MTYIPPKGDSIQLNFTGGGVLGTPSPLEFSFGVAHVPCADIDSPSRADFDCALGGYKLSYPNYLRLGEPKLGVSVQSPAPSLSVKLRVEPIKWVPPVGKTDLDFGARLSPSNNLDFHSEDQAIPSAFFRLKIKTRAPTLHLSANSRAFADPIHLHLTHPKPVLNIDETYLGYRIREVGLHIVTNRPRMRVSVTWLGIPMRYASVHLTYHQPRLSVKTYYDNRVFRGVIGEPDFVHQEAKTQPSDYEMDWADGVEFRRPVSGVFQDSVQEARLVGDGFVDSLPTYNTGVGVFSLALPRSRSTWSDMQAGIFTPVMRSGAFQEALHTLYTASSSAQSGVPLRRGMEGFWEEVLVRNHDVSGFFSKGFNIWQAHKTLPWQEGICVLVGKNAWDVIPKDKVVTEDPNNKPVGALGLVDLNFCEPWVERIGAVNCNFGGYSNGPQVFSWKVRIVSNDFVMTRVDGGAEIMAHSVEIETAKDSWSWSLRATISAFDFEKIEPQSSGPVEIEVVINGYTWRFLVEGYSTKGAFPTNDLTITGRSVTAYLDAPYAATRSLSYLGGIAARQVAQQELDRPGLVTGFDLNWKLISNDTTDWTMQPGFWTYDSLTPIQVINQLVAGVKGVVQSDPAMRRLHILSAYPKGPYWNWTDSLADLVIPRSLVFGESLSMDAAQNYDGVWVSGDKSGVSDFVKRSGFSGQNQPQMHVSPFISSHAAAREAGMVILGSGGTKARVTLDLPFVDDIGLVGMSKLIKVSGGGSPSWMGMSRATKISAQWTDSEGLVVGQSVQIERSYGA